MKKNSAPMRKLAAFVLLITFSANAYSYTFVPEIGVDVKQHSNVGQDASNQEDTVVAPFFGFNFKEANSTIDASADFLVTHEEYLDDTFSSLDLFNINAFVDWTISPERFIWAFDDYAKTQRINATETSNPDNLQTVNVFSIGPDFIFGEGVFSLLGKLRFGDTSYSDSDEDSIFLSGSVAAKRDINEYSRVSSGIIYRTNDFDLASLSDYDVGKLFVDYSRDLPSGQLLTVIGVSYADIDNGNDDTEPYLKLLLSYQPTGAFAIDLSAVNEFTDDAGRAYDATSSRQTNKKELNAGLDELTQPGVYRSRKASLTGKYAGGLLAWNITGHVGDKSFLEGGEFDADTGVAIDTEETGVNVNIAWTLSDRMTFGVGGAYTESDYPSENFNDEEHNAYAALDYRIARKLFAKIGAYRDEKKSNDATREYDDDVVFFSLLYKGGIE